MTHYRQVTWIRPYRPGPLRVAIALLGILVTTLPALIAFSTLLSLGPVRSPAGLQRCLRADRRRAGDPVTRFFAVGVYVNDAGVRIADDARTMAVYPWRLVTDVSPRSPRSDGDQHDAGGDVVVITLRDIGPVATPVHRRSVGLPRSRRGLRDGRRWRSSAGGATQGDWARLSATETPQPSVSGQLHGRQHQVEACIQLSPRRGRLRAPRMTTMVLPSTSITVCVNTLPGC